jgi:hypothetical protein
MAKHIHIYASARRRKTADSGPDLDGQTPNESDAFRNMGDAAIPLPTGKEDRAAYKSALEQRIKELEGGKVRGQQPRDLDDARAQLKRLTADDARHKTGDTVFDAGLIGEEEGLKLGKPVNAEWIRLDKLSPESLAGESTRGGIKAEGKTDQIMALLRKKFSKDAFEAWGLWY